MSYAKAYERIKNPRPTFPRKHYLQSYDHYCKQSTVNDLPVETSLRWKTQTKYLGRHRKRGVNHVLFGGTRPENARLNCEASAGLGNTSHFHHENITLNPDTGVPERYDGRTQ